MTQKYIVYPKLYVIVLAPKLCYNNILAANYKDNLSNKITLIVLDEHLKNTFLTNGHIS